MSNDDQKDDPFAVPSAIAADTRLTLETMRVLMALYSFRDEETGLAFANREALSKRSAGMHPSNISAATTNLVSLGWIIKERAGYAFAIPPIMAKMTNLHKARVKKWKDDRRPIIPSFVKRYVFERDAYRCVKCTSYKNLCVDHKYPWSLGGSNEPDNLQTLCWNCNSKKSNKVETAA